MTITRRPDGTFVKGARIPGAGRPKTKTVDYARLIKTCLTQDAAFAILEKAISQAKLGDAKAREWLFKHVVAPIPRTLNISEGASESREAIDSVVSQLPPDQLAALDAFLAKREQPGE